MQFIGRLMLIGVVVILVSGLCGCKKKDSGEKAGAAADKSVQDAGTAVDRAVQKAGESVETAGEKTARPSTRQYRRPESLSKRLARKFRSLPNRSNGHLIRKQAFLYYKAVHAETQRR